MVQDPCCLLVNIWRANSTRKFSTLVLAVNLLFLPLYIFQCSMKLINLRFPVISSEQSHISFFAICLKARTRFGSFIACFIVICGQIICLSFFMLLICLWWLLRLSYSLALTLSLSWILPLGFFFTINRFRYLNSFISYLLLTRDTFWALAITIFNDKSREILLFLLFFRIFQKRIPGKTILNTL